jgi:uncharacterized protein YrzB (UPF0473 family)
MSEEIKNNEVEEVEEDDGIYTLTDEDGNEEQFELLCSCEFEGGVYYAFVPAYKEDCEEYVILKAIEEENGEVSLTSIDDEEEFDRVADYIEDTVFNEIDYDEETEN